MRLAGVLCQAAAVAASIVQEHQQGAFTLDMYSEQVSRTGRLATLPPPPAPTPHMLLPCLSTKPATPPIRTPHPPTHTLLVFSGGFQGRDVEAGRSRGRRQEPAGVSSHCLCVYVWQRPMQLLAAVCCLMRAI